MKFDCPCGTRVETDAPENALFIVPARDFPALLEAERALAALDRADPGADERTRELGERIGALKQTACECPCCGRVVRFHEAPARPTVYWLDED